VPERSPQRLPRRGKPRARRLRTAAIGTGRDRAGKSISYAGRLTQDHARSDRHRVAMIVRKQRASGSRQVGRSLRCGTATLERRRAFIGR